MKTKVVTIDLEPTWEDLCRGVESGHIKASMLMPACKLSATLEGRDSCEKKYLAFWNLDLIEALVEGS